MKLRTKKSNEIEWMDKILKNSTLNEQDVDEIGHKIKKEIRKRLF